MSQHLDALARGNDFRLRRAQLKREIRTGETTVSEVLRADIPEWLEGEQAGRLIGAIPYLSKKTIHRLMSEAELSHIRPLHHVTMRQRLLLAGEIESWEAKRAGGKRAQPHVKSVASVGRAS